MGPHAFLVLKSLPLLQGQEPPRRYNYTYGHQEGVYVSGLIHHQTVSGLAYDSTYYYVCGSEEGGFSAEHSFKTPPKPSAEATVTFAVVGDLGQTRFSRINVQVSCPTSTLSVDLTEVVMCLPPPPPMFLGLVYTIITHLMENCYGFLVGSLQVLASVAFFTNREQTDCGGYWWVWESVFCASEKEGISLFALG